MRPAAQGCAAEAACRASRGARLPSGRPGAANDPRPGPRGGLGWILLGTLEWLCVLSRAPVFECPPPHFHIQPCM
jgi:hypothetical protein